MTPSLQAFIRVLFQMVWADQVVSPNEVRALLTIFRSLGIPHPEVLCLMDRHLTAPSDESPLPLDRIFPERSQFLQAVKAVMMICLADGKMQPEILGYLEGTLIRMGITAAELEWIRKEVSC